MAYYMTTLDKIKGHIDLSVRLDDERFKFFLRQVQEFDLKPLMRNKSCEAFYHDILKNVDEPDYKALIHGEEYQDTDGNTRLFAGLDVVLAHFWWARYVAEGHMKDTGFDVVQKSSDYSDPISGSQRNRSRGRHYDQAVEYWYEVELYLKAKATGNVFTVYQNCCSGGNYPRGVKSDVI